MAMITTKLVKDGNSMAVRLPKHLLALSGLHGTIEMEVTHEQIILRAVRSPRASWRERIDRVVFDPKSKGSDHDLDAWDITSADGLDETR